MSRSGQSGTPPRRYFESLDLIRGLAALIVLVYHVDFMFGLRKGLLPAGYLAVDLFFVLSGFVLSLTYGPRILRGEIAVRDYLVARLARLYPLFLVTTVLGFGVMTARFSSNSGFIDTGPLVESAVLNVFMLPSFAHPYGSGVLFPFNAATWSIFFEMVASLLFFAALARMASRWLAAFAAAAGLWLLGIILHFGTVDLGWGAQNFVAGFPRVFFSFAVGMLIERAYRRRPWRTPPVALYGLLAIALCLLQLALGLPRAGTVAFDVLAVGLFLPLLVAAGAGADLGARAKAAAKVLGESSYSVYLTQGSLIILAAGMTQALLGVKIYDLAPWVGVVFVPMVVLFSFCTYRWFEDPARRFLRRFATPRQGRPTRISGTQTDRP